MVGDVILDSYVYGETVRVSREAPVLVVRKESREHRLGGAANTAINLVELGAEVGWDTLEAYTEEWFDYSERQMIAQIKKFPSAEFTSGGVAHDPLPEIPDGIPLEVGVRSTIRPPVSRSTYATTLIASPAELTSPKQPRVPPR